MLRLHLRKFSAQLTYLCVEIFLLSLRFLGCVLRIRQIVDYYLVLIVPIFQLDNMISGLILVLLCLFKDGLGLH